MDEAGSAVLEPVPAKHRNQYPPAVTKQRQRDFLEALATTGQHKRSCDKLGLMLSTPYLWAKTNANFAKRFDEAREAGEKVLLARMEEQIDSRVFEGKEDPQSAVLTMFRTKRLDPRYRDNAVVNVAVNGPAAIMFNLGASMQPTQADEQANGATT